ncbi:DEKNAAC105392 [Brettanomyces naardenensis]|uniref:Ubiquitin-like 1-activating enzyme E1A n=1 Tax=Brettanomyces naardenensis TaxID=13370 RepID=A0A448YTE4_BRENA|nr:DEKNAAC105392 [Brettanomyces naardenensis]
MTEDNTKSLTEDEIKLYDRQIRLWGVEAQGNLRNSRILLINLTSVGVEICKNLVLGGVGGITVVDGSFVLEQDLNVNFFIDSSSVGQLKVKASERRIEELNPRVNLVTIGQNWAELGNLEGFIKDFDMVVATGLNEDEILTINGLTRKLRVPFYCSSVHGLYGFIFADLIEHKSTVRFDKQSSKKVGRIDSVSSIISISEGIENDIEIQNCVIENVYREFGELSGLFIREKYNSERKQIKKVASLLPLMLALLKFPSGLNKRIEEVHIGVDELREKGLAVSRKLGISEEVVKRDDETLERLTRQAYCEYEPVSSVLGGAVAQDVINWLVRKERPINNFAVMDGYRDELRVYTL